MNGIYTALRHEAWASSTLIYIDSRALVYLQKMAAGKDPLRCMQYLYGQTCRRRGLWSAAVKFGEGERQALEKWLSLLCPKAISCHEPQLALLSTLISHSCGESKRYVSAVGFGKRSLSA